MHTRNCLFKAQDENRTKRLIHKLTEKRSQLDLKLLKCNDPAFSPEEHSFLIKCVVMCNGFALFSSHSVNFFKSCWNKNKNNNKKTYKISMYCTWIEEANEWKLSTNTMKGKMADIHVRCYNWEREKWCVCTYLSYFFSSFTLFTFYI